MTASEKTNIGLSEIKKMQTKILLQFHEFCHAHQLRYFLYGGTLLGAVRHRGFIPWDDDIDLVMPRPDYQKLLTILQKTKVASHLDIIHHENNPFYPYPFAKLYDTRTICDIPGLDPRMELGIWIDLFPMDGLPANKSLRDQHIEDLQSQIRLLNRCSRKFYFSKNPVRLAKNIGIMLLYSFYSQKKVICKLEADAQKYPYESSPYIGVVAFCGGQNNVIEKAGFEETVMLPFEQYKFDAPGTYRKYLVNLYGADCFEIPPESKQDSGHVYTAWWKEGEKINEVY